MYPFAFRWRQGNIMDAARKITARDPGMNMIAIAVSVSDREPRGRLGVQAEHFDCCPDDF